MQIPTKAEIVAHLQMQLDEKLQTLYQHSRQLQEAQQSETKSTMGDKYETAREMAEQALYLYQNQIQITQQYRNQLNDASWQRINTQIGTGSYVIANNLFLLIGISLGAIEVCGLKLFTVGIQAPIYKQLAGKHVGQSILWLGNEHLIEAIY